MLGKIEGMRRRGRRKMRWLDGITTQWTWVWVDSGSWLWTGRPGVLWFHGVAKSRTRLSDWTELIHHHLIHGVSTYFPPLGRRSLVGCRLWGRAESDTAERLHFHFSRSRIGEGNGNPLQCSCLENPRDGGAWWASVYGVTQSRTRLKRLSSSRTARISRQSTREKTAA